MQNAAKETPDPTSDQSPAPAPIVGGSIFKQIRKLIFMLTKLAMILVGLWVLILGIATVMGGGFARGRQIRKKGQLLLPDIVPGNAWSDLPGTVQIRDSLRSDLGRQWRENGKTEHASVAAFAKLTLDLIALGAPPKLIADANRDALEEIRHTQLCFSLANAIDGKAESPGPLRVDAALQSLPKFRTAALAKLAIESLIDGALHEGVSARIIAKLAVRCEEPFIQKILKEIAQDEFRHATHGWEVVEWCVKEGGDYIVTALQTTLEILPITMTSPLPDAAKDGAWEYLGIHGQKLEADEYAKTRKYLREKVSKLSVSLKETA